MPFDRPYIDLIKPYTYKSPSYLKFIRSKPCFACRVINTGNNIQAHHESCGLGEQKQSGKPHDTMVIPLCTRCHMHRTIFGMEFYNECEITSVDILKAMVLYITEYLETRKVIPGGG